MKRIASIDYGADVGLAIAEVQLLTEHIVLKPYLLDTIRNSPDSVVTFVVSSRAGHVILEQRPANADQIGLQSYEYLFNALIKAGFKLGSALLEHRTLHLIGPGTWKPFVHARQQNTATLGSWEIATQHERDALSMIYYLVQTHSPKLEVIYG